LQIGASRLSSVSKLGKVELRHPPTRRVTGTADRALRWTIALLIAPLCIQAEPARAEDAQPKTLAAFAQYVERSEAQIGKQAVGGEAFLWVERLPAYRRATVESQLRAGQTVIEPLVTPERGAQDDRNQVIRVPGGLIHHWIGTVFIRGANLRQTLALEQDYDHHQEYFRPNVMRSKILHREGNDYSIELWLYEKKVITTVLDTQHQVHYQIVDATHAWSLSRSTRIQEVDDAGKPDEKLEPIGHDHGFLWRMNTYWRFEEKDGGTYVECQSISLTRDIPRGLGWLVGSYLESVPRESLTFTLTTTGKAVLKRIAAGAP